MRILAVPSGAAITNANFLAYDTQVPANDTLLLTIGITLANGDYLYVSSGAGTTSFNAFGSENN